MAIPKCSTLAPLLCIEEPYQDIVLKFLQEFFPDTLLLESQDPYLSQLKWKWTRSQLKICFLCRHRPGMSKFFFEMIHRWLILGRRLDVAALFSTDFHRAQAASSCFTIAEMTLRLDLTVLSKQMAQQMEHNLRAIEMEMRLGMTSIYHASRLLETHCATPLQKSSQIQEKITYLVERNPEHIDYDIFGLLQQFLVMSREEFKMHRSASHLSRLLSLIYLFTQSLEYAREQDPQKHHVRVKIAPVELDFPWGVKEALGICVGIYLASPEELFEERHLIKAIQSGFPGIKIVPHSFYFHKGLTKGIDILYLEVERENGVLFFAEELKKMKQTLPFLIHNAIEIPSKSLFMPRNEEEILRYIVALAGQLHYVKDRPQVILMFDEQKGKELYFTVVVVRILFPTSYSIQYLFGQSETILKFLPDRLRRVGFLRKRYPKEATVFRVHLPSEPFLRGDQTVDMLRARHFVFNELEKVMGELRDYTGGMLAKQVELLDQVQQLLGEKDLLLETFFHALYPVEVRSFLAPEQIYAGFLLWKQILEFPEDKVRIARDQSAVYVIGEIASIPELDPADFGEAQLITLRLEKHLGYCFISSDFDEQWSFLSKFQCLSENLMKY